MTRSEALFDVLGPERAELTLGDGVVLVADIWRPDSSERFPVLLMRQPYGRTIASTVVFAHPAWYAAHGYVVVIQDVRGCGDSGGEFDAIVDEAADGAATLDWAASLAQGNGRLGMYGFSYQGLTQYLAVAGGGRRPDAIAPTMAPWSMRNDWAYEGNCFRSGTNIGWAAQMGWLKATRDGDKATAATLRASGDIGSLTAFLMTRPDLSPLAKWQDDDPSYWSSISPDQLLANAPLDIPALHLGGWCDYMLSGTLGADAAFRRQSPGTTHLVVGPWTHIPWNRSAGSTDAGAAAEYSIDRLHLRFFNFYLKQHGDRLAPVELYDVGARLWRTFTTLPEAKRSSLFLTSTGLAAPLLTDGELTEAPGPAAFDRLVHDPSNPAPLIGGHVGLPAGFANRARADDRADVAVFTAPASDRDVLICGEVILELAVAASWAPFDICGTLSIVSPTGEAAVLATSITRVESATSQTIRLSFRMVCATIKAGQRIRLSLQGSGAPAFPVAHATALSGQPRPIVMTFSHGANTGSRLLFGLKEEI